MGRRVGKVQDNTVLIGWDRRLYIQDLSRGLERPGPLPPFDTPNHKKGIKTNETN
jgi:hypothetical protein